MSDIESEYSDNEPFDTAHEIRPAKASDFRSPGGRNHEKLAEYFQINEEDEVIFLSLLCLCDPKTQPSESNDYVLSIQYITEVFLGIVYLKMVEKLQEQEAEDFEISITSIKFKMSLQIFQILWDIITQLGVADDEGLQTLLNVGIACWEDDLPFWGPQEQLYNDHFNLRTSYLMCCILFNSLNYLFVDNGVCNLALNPYTSTFTKFWRYYTEMLQLQLHVDRYLEFLEQPTPPGLVEMLKGTTMIRYVLGYILNQSHLPSNPSYVVDLTEKSLLDVYDPVVRDNVNGGALTKIIHYYEFLDLILNLGPSGIPSGESSKFFPDHYPSFDELDEDLRYILDYESAEELLDVEGEDSSVAKLRTYLVTTIEQFQNGNDFEDRTPEEVEDLPEYPQGENLVLSPRFRQEVLQELRQLINDINDLTGPEIEQIMNFDQSIGRILQVMISDVNLNDLHILRQKLISLLGQVNFLLEVFLLPDNALDELVDFLFEEVDASVYTPLVEQNHIVPVFAIKNFDVLFDRFPDTMKAMTVELFLARKRTRNIIWKFCHEINLSYGYVDFICQLLVGYPLEDSEVVFSRAGKILELTTLEKAMLLNEFIDSATTFLSASEGIENDDGYEFTLSITVCHKFVHLICLLITKVIKEGMFEGEDGKGGGQLSSLHTIIGFVFAYMSKVPLARTLYFQVLELIKIKDARNSEKNTPKETENFALKEICVNAVQAYKTSQLIAQKKYQEVSKKTDAVGGIRKFLENFSQIYVDSTLWQYLEDIKTKTEPIGFPPLPEPKSKKKKKKNKKK